MLNHACEEADAHPSAATQSRLPRIIAGRPAVTHPKMFSAQSKPR
jgi:hypothetical protein